MPDVIPTTLAIYIEQCLTLSSLTLLTSVLNTQANWLTVRFLHAALHGIDLSGKHVQGGNDGAEGMPNVIFLSVFRPLSLWIELGKKLVGQPLISMFTSHDGAPQGLDITTSIKAKRLLYISGFPPNANAGDDGTLLVTKLKSLKLSEIQSALGTAMRSPTSNTTVTTTVSDRSIVILDGLDFVLASQPEIDTIILQQFLSGIRAQAQSLIITCNADSPLLHNRHDSATPLERDHNVFVTAMAHQSSWVMQLRGLDTGTAKDVTGVLRVSHGGSYKDTNDGTGILADGEWLYQVKGDGSCRLWSRGE